MSETIEDVNELETSTIAQSCISGRRYYLRGEGMANFVIGFVRNGQHMVWRIRKKDVQTETETFRASIDQADCNEVREQSVTIDDELELSLRYVREVIAPLFDRGGIGPKFIALPTRVRLRGEQLVEIDTESKIFSLAKNGCQVTSMEFERRVFSVLEMPDLTVHLPGPVSSKSGVDDRSGYPVIGVEIKPKQGFIPKDVYEYTKSLFASSGRDEEVSYCTNCLAQYEKHDARGDRRKIYDYCPVDLYSGNVTRMRRALVDLMRRPGTHLRLLRNGEPVFDKNRQLSDDQIGKLLFGDDEMEGGLETFVDILLRVLRYSGDREETDETILPKGCVLDVLLRAQQVDQLGPLETAALVEELQKTTSLIQDPTSAFPLFFGEQSSYDDEVRAKAELLRRGLICQTLRDCSIMIAMQVFEQAIPSAEAPSFRPLRLSERLWLKFSVNVVDLDPKTPAKAVRYRRRLMTGADLLRSDYDDGSYRRLPCHAREKCAGPGSVGTEEVSCWMDRGQTLT